MIILLVHIVVALSSVASSTLAYIAPSAAKLRLTYALITGTLVSGTGLVWSAHARILQSCASGLIYVLLISVATIAARRRLALANN